MKGNKIDDLFRSGLDAHKVSAPENAWEKIEASLPQKSKKGVYFWLSVAASFILLTTMGWLALDRQDDTAQTEKLLTEEPAKIEENNTTKAPESQVESGEKTNKAQLKIISPEEDRAITQLPNLIAKNELVQPNDLKEDVKAGLAVVSSERVALKVELIRPVELKQPQLMVRNLKSFNAKVNTDFLMQSIVLSPQEFEQIQSESRKKSGFLNSIVSMAKSVNNSTKVITEIRKSKNEFVSNDLKYGTKTDSEDEDEEDEDIPPSKK